MTAFTPTLKLALPVPGQLSGQWGDVVNDNITSMVEQAITGLATIDTWTTNAHTLTTANGTTSESRCAMLVLTDSGTALSGAATVTCPTAAKLYIVKNSTGQTATIKTAAGTGIAVADGTTMFVFCDGTNVVQAVTSITGATITGATITGATLTSPTLITPALGTPTALVGTNITGDATSFNINGTVGATTPAAGTFTQASFVTYTETVFALTGTTPALSPDNGTIQTWTLSGASTPTAGTWAAGQSLTLMVDDGTAY